MVDTTADLALMAAARSPAGPNLGIRSGRVHGEVYRKEHRVC